ncbi:sensor histidine kinase [Labedaea rhizosphaerae]|uniref:histidine kinase n=1 Tax=Labedaea rhizosphaerae TaxID=598644 RepID=A0A4R6S9G7_LABRH|nr:HAMP domain-containing sensor histidine kinase [Labedaea rhizosphaerae]TDP96572.1 two-component system OmpR family sensor kinase [Labedaea rhizosphaerae]
MSSSRRRRPWTLRTKLIAQLVVVVAGVCLVIGVVTVLSLRSFVLQQLDTQLVDASHRAQAYVEGGGSGERGPHPGPDHRPPPVGAPGTGPGTVTARIVDDVVYDAKQLTLQAAEQQDLTPEATAVLTTVPVDGQGHSKDLPGLGEYRLMAVPTRLGVVVTGLPMVLAESLQTNLSWVLSAVALTGLVAAAGTGILIVRRTLRPLNRVAATASRVAELPLDRGEVALSVRVPESDTDPRTEVGRVGAALNRMLGHIGNALRARHDSETRVRQFVADASHELRTPLAAIRGYAELAKRSPEPVPPDVAHAIGRVESESARMTTLVDDLLLLARLDSGRPLERREVDLSRLVTDVVGDARIAGPAHHWQLDLPPDPVTVAGDDQRLHQVLANLLTNARTHTPAGTTVTTALRVDGEDAVLSVVDDGPGIPPELQPSVFERFARGDSSRSRAAGSTGLGLAIVAAVVAAHDGVVSVSSEPGHTSFEVRLRRFGALS